MKTIIVLISVCLVSTIHAQQVNLCDITGCVGDVKYSILDTSIFEANYPGWILLDGGNSPRRAAIFSISKLHTLLNVPSLPDARGVFLRGMNEGRDIAKGNPSGDKAVGTPQDDAFASHSHPFVIDSKGISFSAYCGLGGIASGSFTGTPLVLAPISPQCAISIGNAGVEETRPRNITLYIYIKVN